MKQTVILAASHRDAVQNRGIMHEKRGTPAIETKRTAKPGQDLRRPAQKLAKQNSKFPAFWAILSATTGSLPDKIRPPFAIRISSFPFRALGEHRGEKYLSPSTLRLEAILSEKNVYEATPKNLATWK
jgi:hypothetical protein